MWNECPPTRLENIFKIGSMRILGIDPGSTRIGYGAIEAKGGALRTLAYGVIEIPPKTPLAERLRLAAARFEEILSAVRPECAGLEKLFFSKNQKTAMAVAETRGALALLLARRRIKIIECEPRAVKAAVSGYGLADKAAVAKMVRAILSLPEIAFPDDASDALAVAIAALGKTV